MVHIVYHTELNLQICNYTHKQCIYPENSKYAPDENFSGHFYPRRKAANFCHPARGIYEQSIIKLQQTELWHKTESPHLVFALVVGLQSVPWFKLKYFHLLLLESLAFLPIFKRRIRGDLGDEKWDIFCLQLLSFHPCCLNDQSFCLPGPPTPLFTFFAHSVNILSQGCISCGPCSYPELTEDHVLPSA